MNEETTTSTPVADPAPTGQADATDEQAVQSEETTETTTSESETPSTGVDDDVKSWAEKKGLPMDDPIAMAKMVREGDKKVAEATQAASQLKSSMDTADQTIGNEDIQQIKNKLAVMDLYDAHPDARAIEKDMAAVLDDKPQLVNDLDALYYFTKGKLADESLLAARQEGSKEALAAAAQAERSVAPKASATTRVTPKEITDDQIRNMSITEYKQAVADGKIEPFGPRP